MVFASDHGSLLGIDIGSVAMSMVKVDLTGNILASSYSFHHGRITETLLKLRENFDLSDIRGIATVSKDWFDQRHVSFFDPQTSVVTAGKALCNEPGSIMLVGAEKFQLIHLNNEGNYEHTATNTSCAVGTGSFLDQQAKRLNLKDVREVSKLQKVL